MRCVAWLLLSAGWSAAQNVGDPPPPLVWDKLKGNCPSSLDWSSLRGQKVELSFERWSTHPSDPNHWKAIDPQALYLQVQGGSEFLLDQALKLSGYQGCVLYDPSGANQKRFAPAGRTAWVSEFGELSDPGVISSTRTELTPTQPPEIGIQITPSSRGVPRVLGRRSLSTYETQNHPMRNIILELWSMPSPRIEFPPNLDETPYTISARIPEADSELLATTVKRGIEAHFGLIIESEPRIRRVYLLTARGLTAQIQPSKPSTAWLTSAGSTSMSGTAQRMPSIARLLESSLDLPVIDQTGLTGEYDYSALTKLTGRDATFDLARQLGRELLEDTRLVEMLVVRRAR